MQEALDIKTRGSVVYFQTDSGILIPESKAIPDFRKEIIPGTFHQGRNTIQNALKYYLAYKIGTDITDKALDALTVSSGTVASVGAANDGKDGIFSGPGSSLVDHILLTTKNAGGIEAEAYVEYYGTIAGSLTLSDTLYLGHNYVNSSTALTTTFATYPINEVVAASRTFHFYWKITIS